MRFGGGDNLGGVWGGLRDLWGFFGVGWGVIWGGVLKDVWVLRGFNLGGGGLDGSGDSMGVLLGGGGEPVGQSWDLWGRVGIYGADRILWGRRGNLWGRGGRSVGQRGGQRGVSMGQGGMYGAVGESVGQRAFYGVEGDL